MNKTITEVIGVCGVCLITKYYKYLSRVRQEQTFTADAPLRNLGIDTFTWRGEYKWITIIDPFRKIAMPNQVQKRSSETVLKALQTWFQF